MTQKITKDRIKEKAYYRAQMNVDQDVVAYGYYPLMKFLGPKAAAQLRNRLAKLYENEIKYQVELLLKKNDETFRAVVRHYLNDKVDKSLQAEAMKFYRSLGWDEHTQNDKKIMIKKAGSSR